MNKKKCSNCPAIFGVKDGSKATLCPACRKKAIKQTKSGVSKWEWEMKKALDSLFPKEDFIDNGYYSWMRSPKNAPLQLDRYYPRMNWGFEFQGSQHYEYSKFFHKKKADFLYYQECDRIKVQSCKNKGVRLSVIAQKDFPDGATLKAYILQQLKEGR